MYNYVHMYMYMHFFKFLVTLYSTMVVVPLVTKKYSTLNYMSVLTAYTCGFTIGHPPPKMEQFNSTAYTCTCYMKTSTL